MVYGDFIISYPKPYSIYLSKTIRWGFLGLGFKLGVGFGLEPPGMSMSRLYAVSNSVRLIWASSVRKYTSVCIYICLYICRYVWIPLREHRDDLWIT